jgi:predicted RNA-binding Zn ribbon-like protein
MVGATSSLCLDFANRLGRPGTSAGGEGFRGYSDLLAWARGAGLLSPARARALDRQARRAPAAAEAMVRRARALGEAIDDVLSAVVERRPPRAAGLAVVNRALGAALGRARIVRRGAGLTWEWREDAADLDQPLGPVARSAAQVLTSGDLARVRRCAAPECQRLFLDTTRNQTRLWCDMATCGNRAKARRFYARRLSGGARAGGRSARGRPGESRTHRGGRARPRP